MNKKIQAVLLTTFCFLGGCNQFYSVHRISRTFCGETKVNVPCNCKILKIEINPSDIFYTTEAYCNIELEEYTTLVITDSERMKSCPNDKIILVESKCKNN